MDIKTLFFSWQGRSTRKPYWVGIVTIELTLLALSFILPMLGVPELIGVLLLAYPRICVVAKRLHDVNRSGWWQVAPNMATNMLNKGAEAVSAGDDASLAGLGLYLLSFAVGAGFLIWLGSIRGQDHKNDFGHPPGQRDVVEVF